MRKASLGIVLALLSLLSRAQTLQNITAYGYEYKRATGDTSFGGPIGCGTPASNPWLLNVNPINKHFLTYYDTCAHKFWVYDPSTTTWAGFTGSSFDTTSLSRRIDSAMKYRDSASALNPYAQKLYTVANLLGAPGIIEDVAANRPLPGAVAIGTIFIANDTHLEYINNGSGWDNIGSASGGAGIANLNGLTASSQIFVPGTSGSDFNINSTGSTHTFNFPSASATVRGLLAASDFTSFAAKQSALSGTGYSKWSGTTPSYLTPTQVTSDLDAFTTSLKGLVPSPGGTSSGRVLQDDGAWHAPSAGFTNPMTTANDIIIGGSGGAPQRLATGGVHTVFHGGGAYSLLDLAADVTGVLGDGNISSSGTWNGKQNALSGTGYSKWSGTTPSYLTATQVTADLNPFTTSLQGLVPPSGGGTTNFLRADGSWAAPPGGGGGTPGGSNKDVQINNSGAFGNVAGFTADPTTHKVTADSLTTHTSRPDSLFQGSNVQRIKATDSLYAQGTSITAGTGATSLPYCYVSDLSNMMRMVAVNQGQGGYQLQESDNWPLTNNWVHANLYKSFIHPYHAGNILFMEWGENDANNDYLYHTLFHVDTTWFKAAYDSVLTYAIGLGWPKSAIYIGSPFFQSIARTPLVYQMKYYTASKTVADSAGIKWVDVFTEGQKQGTLNWFDDIHPNNRGHQDAAQIIYDSINAPLRIGKETQVNADTSIFNNMRINARNIGDSLMFFLLATDKYGNVIKVLPQRFPSMDSTNDGYNHQPNYGNLSVTGNLNAGTGARISGVPVYTSGAGIIFGYGNRDLNADALDIGGSHYGDFVFANGRLVFGNSNVAVRRNFEAYIRGRLNSTGVYVDQDSSEVDPQDSVMLTTMLTNTRGGQIETYQHKAAGNLYFPIFVNKNSKKPVIYNSLIDNGFGHQIWNDEWIQDSLQIGQTRLGDITADSQLVKHGNTVRAVAPQLPAVRASADVTAATGTSSVTTFTPTADGQYQINAYVNITAHTGGEVLITTLTYTDEQNASQTLTFFPQGQTSGTISSSGPADLQPKFIKAKASTAITVTVTFNSVGTVTYDASAAITQLK